MRSVAVTTLVAFLARTRAAENGAQKGYHANPTVEGMIIRRLVDRALEAPPSHLIGALDSATVAKPGHLPTAALASRPMLALPNQRWCRAATLLNRPDRGAVSSSVAVLGVRAAGLHTVSPRGPLLSTAVLASASDAEQAADGNGRPERTYVMVKPDAVQRGLVSEIMGRFERKGFYLKGLKLFTCPEDLAKEHYRDLSSKPFFSDLVAYICSGPVVCMVWEGHGVVASARKLIGATDPLTSEPGTIRGDSAVEVGRNVIHGSDSIDNAEREIGLWFGSGEGMADWMPSAEPWLRRDYLSPPLRTASEPVTEPPRERKRDKFWRTLRKTWAAIIREVGA